MIRLVVASVIVTFGTACTEPAAPLPLPVGAFAFEPEPVFRAWWRQIEECAGARADFDAVTWYAVPGDEPFRVPGHPSPVLGYWEPAGNRIVLLQILPERRAPWIRHEALHAITRRVDHPTEYFVRRCGATIDGPENPEADAALDGVSIRVRDLYPRSIRTSLRRLRRYSSTCRLPPPRSR